MKPIYLYAEVDINDGDYVGDMKQVSPEEAKKLQAILGRIGESSPWWSGDCGNYEDTKEQHPWLTEDDYEFLEEFLPYSEYGYHTLVKAKLFTMNEIFEI